MEPAAPEKVIGFEKRRTAREKISITPSILTQRFPSLTLTLVAVNGRKSCVMTQLIAAERQGKSRLLYIMKGYRP